MKSIKKHLILALAMILIVQFNINVYANEKAGIGEISNVREFNSNGQARVIGTPRGRLISSVEIEIIDKGRGTVGVYADLLCHEPMKQLRIWLYLEQWDSEREDWVIKDFQQFSWLAEDYPDQELTMAMVGYDVSGLERGQDYRLRGLFGANDLDSSLQEAWQARTDNLFVE